MLEMAGSGSASSTVVQWGKAQAGTISSYESMCYKGVWYNLYDNVFCRSGRTKPYVGKLMRLYEEEGVGKVRIRWYFRPEELPLVRKDFLGDMLQSKELFIGLGSGVGVENENLVEVICGKALVICTAKNKDNLLLPSVDIENAHHFFNRAYDVGKKKMVKIGNILNKPLVEKMCNKREWMLPTEKEHPNNCIEESGKVTVVSEEENNARAQGFSIVKEDKEELPHPSEKAKSSGDIYDVSTFSSEKEDLESVVSITNLGGKKRILLKTVSIVSIIPFKKKKI